ncbi:MAG: crosslink repair DNA glycosylase YcaQ family protein [Bacillota bacterium]|nr:crosslink repair DNA glycosylase YcaQ family protein [Bacillota bacterium]
MPKTATTKPSAPSLTVTAAAARRFLVLRTGLGRPAGAKPMWPDPSEVVAAVRGLEYVQVDPMQVLACNHDLVLGARVGAYRPQALDDALYRDRSLVEVIARNRYIVPASDFGIFRLRFAETEQRSRPGLEELEPLMQRVLRRIEAQGPLSSLDFAEETATISGWWEPDGQSRTRAVRQALEWLWHFGRVAISHRAGQRRYFDLPERLFGPGAVPTPYVTGAGAGPPLQDAAQLREALLRKYIRAVGLVDPRDWGFGWTRYSAAEKKALLERSVRAGDLIPVAIVGVTASYFVAAEHAHQLAAAGGLEIQPDLHFLPPLDNLIWLRSRMADLFKFEYTWEAYTPRAKRKYGPYTCPILRGDALVGRIDAHLDRERFALVVDRLWWEPGAPPVSADEMARALQAWAQANGAISVDDPGPALLEAARASATP